MILKIPLNFTEFVNLSNNKNSRSVAQTNGKHIICFSTKVYTKSVNHRLKHNVC